MKINLKNLDDDTQNRNEIVSDKVIIEKENDESSFWTDINDEEIQKYDNE